MKVAEFKFEPYSAIDGWHVSREYGVDHDTGAADALRIQSKALSMGYFSICGYLPNDDRFRLFLAPSDSALEVARAFHLGEHAEYYVADAQQQSQAEVEAVESRVKIAPYFADCA